MQTYIYISPQKLESTKIKNDKSYMAEVDLQPLIVKKSLAKKHTTVENIQNQRE